MSFQVHKAKKIQKMQHLGKEKADALKELKIKTSKSHKRKKTVKFIPYKNSL